MRIGVVHWLLGIVWVAVLFPQLTVIDCMPLVSDGKLKLKPTIALVTAPEIHAFNKLGFVIPSDKTLTFTVLCAWQPLSKDAVTV